MKSFLFCSFALSLAGLLCCHELDKSVYNGFDSPLTPLDENYKIHQIWNNFNDFFKKGFNSFEQVWSSIFPSDNIRFRNLNEIIYPENLSTRKVEENVLKRIVRSGDDHQSTELQVLMHTPSNKTEETSIPKNTTQSETDKTNVFTNTTQSKTSIPKNTTQSETDKTSVLTNTTQSKIGQGVSVNTTHNTIDPSISVDPILNGFTKTAENKPDPSVSINTTRNSTEPNLNIDKTTMNKTTDFSITPLIVNYPTRQNATLDQNTKENTFLSSDISSYSSLKIFSVLALLGIVMGLLYVVYQKKRTRVRTACYHIRGICHNNEETPV